MVFNRWPTFYLRDLTMGASIKVIEDSKAMRKWSQEKKFEKKANAERPRVPYQAPRKQLLSARKTVGPPRYKSQGARKSIASPPPRPRLKKHAVAFVPTMGSLHEGHLALVEEAHKHADCVVVSIYVNPSQFAPNEDFSVYPRSFESDLKKLENYDVDAVFLPRNLYKGNLAVQKGEGENEQDHQSWITLEELEKPLCGITRPHFFRGVATVVTKLFHIVDPDVAVFGRKDFQQLRVIETMVQELDFPVSIVSIPIVRENDGLAMSSRNKLLSEGDRAAARVISESLGEVEKLVKGGVCIADILKDMVKHLITGAGGRVDYVEIVDANNLKPVSNVSNLECLVAVAVFFGKVRLIDNIILNPKKRTHEKSSSSSST